VFTAPGVNPPPNTALDPIGVGSGDIDENDIHSDPL